MFGSELTTVAFCWRLVRADGAALGFTSHDRDLEIGGLSYLASPGMIPAAVERAVRLLTSTQTGEGTWHDRPIMTGPRPFLSVTPAQVHALAARGLGDALTQRTGEGRK